MTSQRRSLRPQARTLVSVPNRPRQIHGADDVKRWAATRETSLGADRRCSRTSEVWDAQAEPEEAEEASVLEARSSRSSSHAGCEAHEIGELQRTLVSRSPSMFAADVQEENEQLRKKLSQLEEHHREELASKDFEGAAMEERLARLEQMMEQMVGAVQQGCQQSSPPVPLNTPMVLSASASQCESPVPLRSSSVLRTRMGTMAGCTASAVTSTSVGLGHRHQSMTQVTPPLVMHSVNYTATLVRSRATSPLASQFSQQHLGLERSWGQTPRRQRPSSVLAPSAPSPFLRQHAATAAGGLTLSARHFGV